MDIIKYIIIYIIFHFAIDDNFIFHPGRHQVMILHYEIGGELQYERDYDVQNNRTHLPGIRLKDHNNGQRYKRCQYLCPILDKLN
jgi:hypothetical protein